jgi:hypothetical protein
LQAETFKLSVEDIISSVENVTSDLPPSIAKEVDLSALQTAEAQLASAEADLRTVEKDVRFAVDRFQGTIILIGILAIICAILGILCIVVRVRYQHSILSGACVRLQRVTGCLFFVPVSICVHMINTTDFGC